MIRPAVEMARRPELLEEGRVVRRRVFVFLSNLLGGGADRVTLTLLRHLDRRRFDPVLVLMRREGFLIDEVPSDVPVRVLGAKRLRFAWLSLARLIRRERPDILLSMSSGGNVIAALAAWLGGRPRRLIVSERNTFSIARRERISRFVPIYWMKRMAYTYADTVVAVSRGVAADLIGSLRLADDHVVTIYNPIVDDALLALADEAPKHPWFAESTPVVLAVGRLVAQKDYPTLLRAFAAVRREHRARLIILGEGSLRGMLESLCADLGIADDVSLPGYVMNPFPHMRHCTVYVLSSRFEGLPGALIQAMACGAAVIATDCPSGPAEIIEDGRSGLLVPVGDSAEMAASILRLLHDPGLRQRLAAHGRVRAAHFGVETMVNRFERVLLGDGADPAP